MDIEHNQNYEINLIAPGYRITGGKTINQTDNLFLPGKNNYAELSIPFEQVSNSVASDVTWGIFAQGLYNNTSFSGFKEHDITINMIVPDRDWRDRLISDVLYEITNVQLNIYYDDAGGCIKYYANAELSSIDFKDNDYVNGLELDTKFTIKTPFVSEIEYKDNDNKLLNTWVTDTTSNNDVLKSTAMGSSLTVNKLANTDLIRSLYNHVVYLSNTPTAHSNNAYVLDNGLEYYELKQNNPYIDVPAVVPLTSNMPVNHDIYKPSTGDNVKDSNIIGAVSILNVF